MYTISLEEFAPDQLGQVTGDRREYMKVKYLAICTNQYGNEGERMYSCIVSYVC